MSKEAHESTGGSLYTIITPLDLSKQAKRGHEIISHGCRDHEMCRFHMPPISVNAADLVDKYEFLSRPKVGNQVKQNDYLGIDSPGKPRKRQLGRQNSTTVPAENNKPRPASVMFVSTASDSGDS